MEHNICENCDILKCTNSSLLQIMERATLEVQIGQITKIVRFMIVKGMSPSVVRNIKRQEQFGFKIIQIPGDKKDSHMRNITGKFGRTSNNKIHIVSTEAKSRRWNYKRV